MALQRRRPKRVLDIREVTAQVQAEYEALGISRGKHGARIGITRIRMNSIGTGNVKNGYRHIEADIIARQWGYPTSEVRMAAGLLPTLVQRALFALDTRDMRAVRIAYEALREAGYK